MHNRRHLRTRNPHEHIVAVRERKLLTFDEACTIAGETRFGMKRALGPNGEPFFRVGRRLYIRPTELRVFLTNRRAAARA